MKALRGRGTRLPGRDMGVASCRFWPVKNDYEEYIKERGQKTYNPCEQRNGGHAGLYNRLKRDSEGDIEIFCHSYVTSDPRYNHITVM